MFKLCLLVVATVVLSSHTVKGLKNGANVRPGEFPYHAFILYEDKQIRCNGALISDLHVLTAGHCISPQDMAVDSIFVLVGTKNVKRGGKKYGIELKAYREELDHSTLGIDIGVLTLKEAVKLSKRISIVKLPTTDYKIRFDSYAVLSSAGSAGVEGPCSNVLQKLDIQVISHCTCQSILSYEQYTINENQICTVIEENKGIGKGDSGAPLVQDNVIIGITSHAIEYFGISNGFQNVTHLMPWIEQQIGD